MKPKCDHNETMANMTIRNIPDSILERIKALSARERRSVNSEILVLLEEAVRFYHHGPEQKHERAISADVQADMWMSLSGAWDDERSAAEIVADIYENRTSGREVDL